MKELLENVVADLKKVIAAEQRKGHYENALKGVEICGDILYRINQSYTDGYLEKTVAELSKQLFGSAPAEAADEADCVLLYDGFGFNSRGLARLYLDALTQIADVVYVTHERRKNSIPDIIHLLETAGAATCFLKEGSLTGKIEQLDAVIRQYRPKRLMMYAVPNDVVVATVYARYAGQARRYQVNLTDHAFWLGTCALDTCIEFRNYGASISKNHRGIGEEKLALLPFYPVIDDTRPFEGFPFPIDTEKQRVIFSGGALYKTLGDGNRYYEMVSHILKSHPEAIFWYAGSGDRTEMDKLIRQYPGRVYLTPERGDLYQVLRHCFFYLSTYPLSGGLMYQYAAQAGRIPVTLRYDVATSPDGVLIGRPEVEFDGLDSLYEEVDRLFADEAYKAAKERQLKGSVMTPEAFRQELGNLLLTGKTSYEVDTAPVDTAAFRQGYLEQTSRLDLYSMLARRKGWFVMRYMPLRFVTGLLYKAARKFTPPPPRA